MDNLLELIKAVRKAKEISSMAKDNFDDVKEKLRGFMIDEGIGEYNGVVIRRTFSYDTGALKLEFPKLAKIYVEAITTTKTKDVISKKNLTIMKAKHPEAYNSIRVENTAQVRGL